MKPKVLVDMERRRFHRDAIEILDPVANLHFQLITNDEALAEHRDTVAIIAGSVRVDEALLQAASGLRIDTAFGWSTRRGLNPCLIRST